MNALKEKTAVITGGSEGVGFAIAEAYARAGANLVLIARDENKLKSAEERLSTYGVNVASISFDLTQVESIDSLAEDVLDLSETIDVLVNNAALAIFGPMEGTTLTDLQKMITMNITSVYTLTQHLMPALKHTRGNVINISSFHANSLMPGLPSTAYAMTKGALNSFTRALAHEVGPMNIRVNAIAPGNVLTKKVKAHLAQIPESRKQQFNQLLSMCYPLGGKPGSPSDIAGASVFLASAAASWITGTILNVDGGFHLK